MTRFIVEADGGSRGNPGPAAYGAVVRDAESGDVLAERAEHIGNATNNVAEYRGLIAGLTAARELDPTATIEARLDSKLVVEQMSGRWKIKHPSMQPLALKAREILPPEQVTYVWVPRELNKHADRLANEALDAAARGDTWSESTSNAALDVRPRPGSRVNVSAASAVGDTEVRPSQASSRPGWEVGIGTPTTFVMLRHGETVHTAEKRFSGSGGEDPPLSAIGEEQAHRAAAVLDGRGITAVVSSPLRRARQTADIVARALRLSVRVVDDIRECAFGEWEGLTIAEVRDRFPDELEAWWRSTAVPPPGGESFDEVDRRVRRARDQVITRHPEGTVLVVSHVSPIKVLVRDALEAPVAAMFRMELSPASVTEIQWFASGTASMRSFNEAAHLHG
ncbi:MAG: bifunctional RNase H/acid phosphatase [Actinomycetes bacterium]